MVSDQPQPLLNEPEEAVISEALLVVTILEQTQFQSCS